jgi:hypothetical protein
MCVRGVSAGLGIGVHRRAGLVAIRNPIAAGNSKANLFGEMRGRPARAKLIFPASVGASDSVQGIFARLSASLHRSCALDKVQGILAGIRTRPK